MRCYGARRMAHGRGCIGWGGALVAAGLAALLACAAPGPEQDPAGRGDTTCAECLALRVGDAVDASNGRIGLDTRGFRRAVHRGLARAVDFEVEALDGAQADGPAALSGSPAGRRVAGAAAHGDEDLAVANLFVDARSGDEGTVELEVALHVSLPARQHTRFGTDAAEAFVVVEGARLTGDGVNDAATVEDAVAIAMGVVEARLVLSRADRGRIAALLASPDEHQVQLVLEWLATQPERAVEWPERGVLAALAAWHAGSAAPGVASAAVDAVGRIGDARHVPVLLSRVSVVDDLQALRTYDALSSLGGADAVAFLDFAARNERTLERRRAASLALDSLGAGADPKRSDRAASRDTLREPPRNRDRRPEFSSLRGHR